MDGLSLDSIRSAAGRIAGRVHRTPLPGSATLSRIAGHTVRLKAENLQKTGSFKPRGALNRCAELTPGERSRGVLTASAGNHSQGLAFAAASLGVPVTVVMPASAQPAKCEASRDLGARVILHGEIFDDALEKALRMRDDTGMTFVHPCIDPAVVSGAGTVGLEILEACPEVDAIVVPIGGGGLISGIATAVKALAPDVRIFGVEPETAPAMKRSFDAGSLVTLETARSIADGMAGRAVFQETLDVCRRLVEDVILVSEASMLDAIVLLLTRCKILAEAAGAAPVAALVEGLLPIPPGSTVVAVISGGNQDTSILSRWLVSGVSGVGPP